MINANQVLANYVSIRDWKPKYGDYIVWSKWFRTWYGLVVDINNGTLSIIFEGLPVLLFTMDEDSQDENTRKIKLSDIKNARPGQWTALQRDTNGTNVWYV